MKQASGPVTIAIAEDDLDDQLIIKEAFEECDLDARLLFVDDGEQLMNLLRREGPFSSETEAAFPALVLLDLNMPKMDGRETLRLLKNDEQFCRLPVIVLTTSKAEEDVINTYGLGVNSFIAKPGSFDKLVEIVRLLHRYWIEMVALPGECPEDEASDRAKGRA